MANLCMYFLFGVIIIIGHTIGLDTDNFCTKEPPCITPKITEEISRIMSSIAGNKAPMDVSTFLDEYCSEGINFMDCIVTYNRTCTPLLVGGPIHSFESIRSLLLDICKNPSTRKRYERLASCLNGDIDEIMKTQNDITVEMTILGHRINDDGVPVNERIRVIACVAPVLAKLKLKETLSRICSIEDGDFIDEMFSRILKPMNVLCPEDDKIVQDYLHKMYDSRAKPNSGCGSSLFRRWF